MRPFVKTWIFRLLVLLVARQAEAAGGPAGHKDHTIDVWQVEQGLPDNTVTKIVQTPDGYLWFGTFNGLVRFDGVRFQIFNSRTPGLESERVLRLFVDHEGGLWICTEQGQLSRYADGRFKSFRREDGWPMEKCVSRGMAVAPDGAIFFLTNTGHLLRFDGKRFNRLPIELGDDPFLGMLVDVDGRLWLKHTKGLRYVEKDQLHETRDFPTEEPLELGPMCRSRDGGLWVFNRKQLLRVQGGRGAIEILESPIKQPILLEEDETGQIWMGAWGEGLVLLARDGSYQTFNTASGLPSNLIRTVLSRPRRQSVAGNKRRRSGQAETQGLFEHRVSA
ncbi:MAG: hypothetical protein L0Z50_12085 [Verrucomicrobiales bacterium]|nr:hypothetical protein [Verrucomicrobiales bacterium]